MVQRLLALAILLVCVLWLVVSYVPSLQTLLPTLAFAGSERWLAMMAMAALGLFVAIQLWLVYTTVNTVRAHQAKHSQSPFRLKLGVELFWTALPIAMTIGLAWASYALWLNLTNP